MSAEGTPDCLKGVDAIEWAMLSHAYGEATDVPDALRALTQTDAEAHSDAWVLLYSAVLHQGSIYTSTPVVMRFLAQMLEDEHGLQHAEVLRFFENVGESVYYQLPDEDEWLQEPDTEEDPESHLGYRKGVIRSCYQELVAALPVACEFARHPKAEIRVAAVRMLTWVLRIRAKQSAFTPEVDPDRLLDFLRIVVLEEPNPLAGGGMIAILGQAAADRQELEEDLERWLRPPHGYPARLAAAEVLIESSRKVDIPIALALVDGLAHWDAYYDEDDDSTPNRLHVIIWDWLRDTLGSVLHWGDCWYDPATAKHVPNEVWAPFPHCPTPWMRGMPVESPTIPVSPVGRAAFDRLQEWTRDPDPTVRARTSQLLLEYGYGSIREVEAIVAGLRLSEQVPFRAALRAVARAGSAAQGAVPALLDRLDGALVARAELPSDHWMRRWGKTDAELILQALGSIGKPAGAAVPRLLTLLESPEGHEVESCVTTALYLISIPHELTGKLLTLLKEHSLPTIRGAAAQLLGVRAAEPCGLVVSALLATVRDDSSCEVRVKAAEALDHLGIRDTAVAVGLLGSLNEVLVTLPPNTNSGSTSKARDRLRVLRARCYPRALEPEEARRAIVETIQSQEAPITDLAEALCQLGPAGASAMPLVLHRLGQQEARDEDDVTADADYASRCRCLAVFASIERMGVCTPELVKALKPWLKDDEIGVAAARTLFRVGAPASVWLPLVRQCALAGESWWHMAAAEILWLSGHAPSLAHDAVMKGLGGHDHLASTHAALALIPMGISAFEASPFLWQCICEAYETCTPQVTGEPFRWVRGQSVAFAGALWGMGLRSQPALDLLAYGMCDRRHRSTAFEAIRRLGAMARPFAPVLRALAARRLDDELSNAGICSFDEFYDDGALTAAELLKAIEA